MTDSELVHGLLQKDPAAFRVLVERYQDQVYRTSLSLVQNSDDAEDITQDVFIEVFQSVSSFRGDARLSTWLYRIAVNKSLNLIRKNKRRELFIPIENLLFGRKSESTDTAHNLARSDNSLEDSERARILNRAVSSLPENQRIAFTLHKIEELSHKEIAQIMDNSVSSVESLIFRAKVNLQKKLLTYYNL
ncbi:MAG: RNA polymerase sigma factor [Bacteroidales bacterium]